VIGAALRGEPLSHPNDGFVDAVLARIATVEKDRAGAAQPPAEALTALPPAPPMTQPARNDARWSWGAVAAAVVAAVVVALLALPAPEGKGGAVPGVAQRSPLLGSAGPLAVSGRAPSSSSYDSGGAITRVAVSHSPYYILAHSPTQPVGGWSYRAESSAAPLTARSNR
jgi:negative regulator of sigma E activity